MTHAETEAALAVLDSLDFTRDLCEADRRALAARLVPRRYAPGEIVFAEGDHGQEVMFVIRGSVMVIKEGQGGQATHILAVKPGGHFGDMAFLDREPRSAAARAEEPSELLVLTRPAFETLLDVAPAAAAKVLWRLTRTLSLRLRDTTNRLLESA